MYFGDWSVNSKNTSRLSFTFNVTPSSFYSYLPAYVQFKDNIKVVHFIGTNKPWKQIRTADGKFLQRYICFNSDLSEQGVGFLKAWWAVFDRHALHENLKEFVLDRDWSRYDSSMHDPLSPFHGLGRTKHHVKLENMGGGGMDLVNYHVDWNDQELGKLKKLNIHRRPSFEQKNKTPSPTDSNSSSKSKKKNSRSGSSVSGEANIADEQSIATANYVISSHGTIHYSK
jgi:lipopolysaccharide biosynthesis glycosyltransferase